MLERLNRFVRQFVRIFRFKKKSGESDVYDRQLVTTLTRSKIPTFAQLKKIVLFLTVTEKRILVLVVFTVFSASAWWTYDYYRAHISTVPTQGGVLTEALIGQPKFINPVLAQTSDTDLDLTRLIYSGLLAFDAELNLITDLAESYTVDSEQKIYTFRLKEGLQWQDGSPLTVDDVIFTLQAIQNPEWQSPLLVSFKGVTIDKINEHTVAFNLPEPFAPFLTLMTTGLIPKHIWEDIPPSSSKLAELNIKPIGSGAWKFSELAKDRSGNIHTYTLTLNDQYGGSSPYISKIIFKFYPDFLSAIDALNQNQVMSLSFLPNDLIETVADSEKYNFHELKLPQYTALFFNQKQNEFLNDKSVRQALAYATDEQRLVKNGFLGRAVPIHSPILQNQIGYLRDGDPYDFNPEAAKQLLADAGWEADDDGKLAKDGIPLSLTISTVQHSENQRVASLLQNMWSDIGMTISIREVPANEVHNDVLRNRNFDVLLYGEIIGADPDPFPFWHSSQAEHPGLNLAQFRDANTDTLLEEARQTNDQNVRKEKYEEFQRIIAKELPAIFLYSPTYTYVHDKRIRDFSSTDLIIPADRFITLHSWYLKTKKVFK